MDMHSSLSSKILNEIIKDYEKKGEKKMTKKESIELKADTIRRGVTKKQMQILIRISRKIPRTNTTILSLILMFCFLGTILVPLGYSLCASSAGKTTGATDRILTKNETLTRSDLPILKAAVPYIKNTQYQKIIQTIILTLEKKGTMRREELEQIAAGSNTTIRIGCVIRTSNIFLGGYCEGVVYSYPGLIRTFGFGYINKGGVVRWASDQGGGYVNVSGESDYNEGVSLGYVGWVRMTVLMIFRPHDVIYGFQLNGIALLTFLSEKRQ